MKQEKKVDISNLEEHEKLKYEVAEELGLLDTIIQNGWKSLPSKQTGKIGGIVARRRRNSIETEDAKRDEK